MISLSLLIAFFGRRKKDLTDGIVRGTVLWAVILYAVTEVLSLFHALTRPALIVFYLLFIATEVVLLERERKKSNPEVSIPAGGTGSCLPDPLGVVREHLRSSSEAKSKSSATPARTLGESKTSSQLEPSERVKAVQIVPTGPASILLILFSLLIIVFAIKRVPDNLDSMTYHLSRVVHWTQNRSIEHYATNIVRQVTCPVLSELIVLHGYILLGKSDILAALPQTIAFILSGIMVLGIGKKLGLKQKESALAAVLFYTMPIAFAEAQTTQTDVISAFWALVFGYLTLVMIGEIDDAGPVPFKLAILLGLTAGLGYLTKVNICIPMFGFCLGILISFIKYRTKFITVVTTGGTIGGTALILALPEIARNMVTFGHTSDPIITSGLLVGNRNPAYLLVSFLKAFCFNMPAVWLYKSSDAVYHIVSAVAAFLHVNIDDPSIAHVGRAYMVSSERAYSSETGTAPLIFWLFVIGIFLYPRVRKKLDLTCRIYAVSAALTFLAFLAMLRWTPYIARYMIGSFGLLCPAVVLVFRERLGEEKRLAIFRAVLLFISAAELFGMIVFHGAQAFSSHRPGDYFLSDELRADYAVAAELINTMDGKPSVGLWMGEDDPEYSLLMLLDERENVRHVLVENGSKRYADPDFVPDAVIAIGKDAGERIEWNGSSYALCSETKENRAQVYVRQ